MTVSPQFCFTHYCSVKEGAETNPHFGKDFFHFFSFNSIIVFLFSNFLCIGCLFFISSGFCGHWLCIVECCLFSPGHV